MTNAAPLLVLLALVVLAAIGQAQVPQVVQDLVAPADERCQRAELEPVRAGGDPVPVRVRIANVRESRSAIVCVFDEDGRKVFQKHVVLPRESNWTFGVLLPESLYAVELDIPDEGASGRDESFVVDCAPGVFQFAFRTVFATGGVSELTSGDHPSQCVETEVTASAMMSIDGADPPAVRGQSGALALATWITASFLLAVAGFQWPRLRVLFGLLFSRLERGRLLDQRVRARVHELVRAQPAVHAAEVARILELPRSHALYHLNLLERSGLLVSKRAGARRRFFLVGQFAPAVMAQMSLLQDERCARVAEIVRNEPGIGVLELADRMRVSHSFASKLSRRLEEFGIIQRRPEGRAVRLYASGPG